MDGTLYTTSLTSCSLRCLFVEEDNSVYQDYPKKYHEYRLAIDLDNIL